MSGASANSRALVLGAHGTLGKALAEVLPVEGWDVVALPRAACDIADPAAVEAAIAQARPGVVFNAAAYTNVDAAEKEIDAAWAANALAPETLARACDARGVALVHYSTDFVFDGALGRPYDEFDEARPLMVYGRSKLAGERLAAAASRRVYLLRVGCLYGRGGRNFPSTMVKLLREGRTLRADTARWGSPTWVHDVARQSSLLARTERYGLYHCTSQGETTWADYAAFLAAELGLPSDRVQAMPTEALGLTAARPQRAVLENRMLKLRGLDRMPHWREAARAFIAAGG